MKIENKVLIGVEEKDIVDGKFVIPDNVIEIGGSIFNNSISLKEVDLNNVTTIGDYAFSHCINLTTVFSSKLCKYIKVVGDYGFWCCTSLVDVNINTFTRIEHKALEHCESLSSKIKRILRGSQ